MPYCDLDWLLKRSAFEKENSILDVELFQGVLLTSPASIVIVN